MNKNNSTEVALSGILELQDQFITITSNEMNSNKSYTKSDEKTKQSASVPNLSNLLIKAKNNTIVID